MTSSWNRKPNIGRSAYDPLLEQELAPFRRLDPAGPLLQALLDAVPRGEQRTVDMLVALNRAVQSRVAYIVRMEPGVWTPEETLAAGQGSCRDSAWLLVQALRQLGYAARFVSGYLIQLVADVKPLDGPEGPTSDFTDLHAWAEAYLPGAGWVGLDATSGLLTGEGHIPLAATPDPHSAAPITGLVEKCEDRIRASRCASRASARRRGSPSPTPTSQWQDILAMGAAVDRALAAGNVRLTMGGEPTFVSATDIDEAGMEHRCARPDQAAPRRSADAPAARALGAGVGAADRVGQALSGRAAAALGAVCPLARGWRAGLARSRHCWPPRRHRLRHAQPTPRDSARLWPNGCRSIPSLIHPAYEDIHYYLWREHRLPANVLAEDAKLADPMERARLARVFGQGLGAPVGSVLPLRRVIRDDARVWQSGRWFFRGDTLFLLPGDSPIGYRLPLDSLPWADPDRSSRDRSPIRSPRAPPAAAIRHPPAGCHDRPMGAGARGLPPGRRRSCRWSAAASPTWCAPRSASSPATACIHVFFPPLYAAEDWLALVAAVEDTAGRARPQGGAGRLPAAARSAPAAFLGHARPRRDRGQRASRVELDGDRRSAARSCTRRRARSAWPRKNSCSTAAMSAPAAATTW